MRDCLGLSVGATNLVAVADHAPLIRRLDQLVRGGPLDLLGDVVGRVGDPVPLIASDGSTHRGERVLAAAVEALTREASPVRRPDVSVLAAPAYWSSRAVAAARSAMPGIRVVPDSVAALTAMQAHPGLPARGVVALVDLGASGTSLTLADAGAGFATIGHSIRYAEFSGDLIDQELLRTVLSTLDAEPAGTASVSTLARLREQCRVAKEQLSDQSAVSLSGPAGAIRLTRTELDAVLDQPLTGMIETLFDALRRKGIHPQRLAALVTVGGGARIPLLTQRLSESFRMPVTTVAQAQVMSSVGAALLARRGADETATQICPPMSGPGPVTGTVAAAAPALAWSDADEVAEVAAFVPESVTVDSARPEFVFGDAPPPPTPAVERVPWYRRGGVLVYAGAFLAVVGTVGMVLSARADRVATESTGSTLAAPHTVPAESPMAQTLPAPPTRTVVVRDPSWPAPAAAPTQAAPRPAAAPRRVQSAPVAPAPQRVAPAPRPPAPAPGLAAPVPIPIPVPPLVFPPITLPQLPPPTVTPPKSESPSPTPQPTQEPEPSPSPSPEPSPSPSPEPEPAPETTPAPEPTVTAEPAPEPTPTSSASLP